MAISNAIKNFKMTVNPDFVAKAQALTPTLIETEITPVRTVAIVPDGPDFGTGAQLHRLQSHGPG